MILMKQQMMGVALASDEPYENRSQFAADVAMPAPHHSVFYRLDALPNAQNQQCQSTEGR